MQKSLPRTLSFILCGNIVIFLYKINRLRLKYSSPVIPDAIFTNSRKNDILSSLSNDSCFHAPEEEIELIEWYPKTPGKAHKLLFDGEIFLPGESLRERTDCTQAFQVSQNVAIKYCQPTVPAHVSECEIVCRCCDCEGLAQDRRGAHERRAPAVCQRLSRRSRRWSVVSADSTPVHKSTPMDPRCEILRGVVGWLPALTRGATASQSKGLLALLLSRTLSVGK